MAHDAERQRLLDFLDEHIFDPVLRMSPDRADRREAFEDAQARTARIKAWCHACRSAEELRRFCFEVAASRDGSKAERELDRLGLPTFSRLAAHFRALCEQLGVGAREAARAALSTPVR